MARDRRVREAEDLKGIIRNQSKQIKHLKKEILKLQKFNTKVASSVDSLSTASDKIEEVPESLEIKSKMLCPRCGKSTPYAILGNKAFVNCKYCGHRKLIKLK